MMKFIFHAILLMFIFSSGILQAQVERDTIDPTQKVIVSMKNGAEFKGVILKKDKGKILLKTVNGEINLIADNVLSIENDNYRGVYDYKNPHETRYFFGPSARPLGKGEGYYQNVLVTGNFFNYGITDNISIGGGFEFVSTILGEPIWFLTPKVGFEVGENIHVGGGFIMTGIASEGSATLGYGVFSVGHSETNLSLGVGYGFWDGEISRYPAIMIGGTHRVSNSIALLSENYIITDGNSNTTYFGIHGIRILAKKNAFDIGGILIPEITGIIPLLPYVSYTRMF